MSSLKFALFTGCTAKESSPELLKSTLAVANALKIELIDIKEASCCGAGHLQDYDEMLGLILNARNICYAEKLGLDMVTICGVCQNHLLSVKNKLDNDFKLKEFVNKKLSEVGLNYKGTAQIKHFLSVLRDDYGYQNISRKIIKPFTNINIASYYGCYNNQPDNIQKKTDNTDNPFNPVSLDNLVLSLGGNAIKYESNNKCCGFHVEIQNPKTANKLSGIIISDAIDNNADVIVTLSPLCHLRLDSQQNSISNENGRDLSIPILHLSQMIGIALGIESKLLGLEHNIVPIK